MTPKPPEIISFLLLKGFAPGSLLFIPWGSYVRFHEDILWCLCCCNRLRLWGGAVQLVYIFPSFRWSRFTTNVLLICDDISPLLDAAKTIYELPDWGMDNVKFSFQASMGCFGVVVCSVNAAYCALVHAPNLWRRLRGGFEGCYVQVDRHNCLPTSSGWAWVHSALRWIKHQKRRPNCQLVQTRAQLSFWHWGQTVDQHCSVAEDRSRKAGPSYFSSGGIDIHEVLHVEMLVEQSLSLPSKSPEIWTLDWKVAISFW